MSYSSKIHARERVEIAGKMRSRLRLVVKLLLVKSIRALICALSGGAALNLLILFVRELSSDVSVASFPHFSFFQIVSHVVSLSAKN